MSLDNITVKVIEFSRDRLSEIAELEKICFSNPMSEKNIESLLLSETGRGFVCIETNNGNAVAYGGLIIAADEAQILNIATHPNHRRSGFGKLIVEALIDYAIEKKASEISLEVRESNLPAIKLYSGYGFLLVGQIKNYYKNPKEDALILKKNLSDRII